jgi:hypothetical protein
MRSLIAFPVLAIVVILQSAVISRIPLLAGYADLMLVTLAAWALQKQVTTAWHWAALGGILIGFVSAMPWIAILVAYLFVVALANIFQRRVWRAPLLAMLTVTFFGTLFMQTLSFLVLRLMNDPLLLNGVLGLVVLPSVLLNLLLAIPVYALTSDLAGWIYPPKEKE